MSQDAIRELELRLARLEAEREIHRTLYDYGFSLDYGDEAMWLDCWTEDAVLQWPWRDPISGREAFVAAFHGHTHAPDKYHKHFVLEPRVTIDGDEATVSSYYTRLDRDHDQRPYMRSFGRYLDRLRRGSDGRWRFYERVAENEARYIPQDP